MSTYSTNKPFSRPVSEIADSFERFAICGNVPLSEQVRLPLSRSAPNDDGIITSCH